MSYNKLSFCLNRGILNTNNFSNTLSIHTFTTTDDSMATILSSNYFSPYFGFDSSEIKSGDLVYLSASDDVQVKSINDPSIPSFNSANFLNAYSINNTVSITYTGPWTPTTLTRNIEYVINNDVATVTFLSADSLSGAWGNISATLPDAIIFPKYAFYEDMAILNASGSKTGYLTIDTSGNILIKAYTNGTGSTSYGFNSFSISYPVNKVGA